MEHYPGNALLGIIVNLKFLSHLNRRDIDLEIAFSKLYICNSWILGKKCNSWRNFCTINFRYALSRVVSYFGIMIVKISAIIIHYNSISANQVFFKVREQEITERTAISL